MVNKSKAKGSKFEIMIYNDMKTYLTEVKRVGGSGTLKGENADILCDVNSIEYCVECKHYKNLTMKVIDDWWDKIKRQAKEIDRKPLLIYRQNRQPIMIRTLLHLRDFYVVADMKYLVWKRIMKKYEVIK